MTDFPTLLEMCMESRNFHIRGKINWNISGKFQRFTDATKNKRDKALFVVLHDGDRGATFGDWHYEVDWYTFWNPNYSVPSLHEQLWRKRELEMERKLQQYDRHKRGWRANELFHRYYATSDCWDHPYIKAKRIRPLYARQVRSWLLIPIRDIDYNFVTVQIIKPNGFKRAWKGTTYVNNMVWLSERIPPDYDGVIRICEGYATGCAIYEAIGSPVICALSAGNLLSVTKQLAKKYPKALLHLCADNDQWGRENIGINCAKITALQTGAMIFYPDFTGLDIKEKPTDFNDLMCLNGIECVENQLLKLRLI